MDIVECLRATTESNELNAQAVAEIERLRALLKNKQVSN